MDISDPALATVVAGALPPLAALAAKPASTGMHLTLGGAILHEQSKNGGQGSRKRYIF